MMPACDDRAGREPVWRALSDLYLDAPVRPHVRAAAAALAPTRYSAHELRAILLDEVHPAVCANLCATAGVWDAFDMRWLAETILAQQGKPRWMRARGRCTRRHAEFLWRLLAPRIARARAASTRVAAPPFPTPSC